MGLIESLRDLLLHRSAEPDQPGTGKKAAESRAARAPVTDSAPGVVADSHDPDIDAFAQALAKNQKSVLAGSIELLGLDDVKRELGERWDRVGAQIQDIAKSEIKRYLSENDYFKPHGDTRFVICFSTLDRKHATHRATLISRAIKARLLEDLPEIEEQTGVNRFVTEVDPKDIATGSHSLVDRLAATLEKMQCEVEMVAATQRRLILKDFQLLFSPIWHIGKQITSYNRAVVDKSLISRALAKVQALGDEMQVRKTIAEIDCMTLARAIERLHRAQRTDRSTALLVPVTFGTFLSSVTSKDYFRLLASVPVPYRDKIILEIGEIEQNITIKQVHALTTRLRNHVDKISIEIALGSALLPMFSPGDVYALGCSLAGCGERDRPALQAFVKLANEAHAVTFAHSANTLGLAMAAIDAGFAHVDGPAVHLNTTDPRPALRLKPMVDLGRITAHTG